MKKDSLRPNHSETPQSVKKNIPELKDFGDYQSEILPLPTEDWSSYENDQHLNYPVYDQLWGTLSSVMKKLEKIFDDDDAYRHYQSILERLPNDSVFILKNKRGFPLAKIKRKQDRYFFMAVTG